MQVGAEKVFPVALLQHFKALMGPLGLYQHAIGTAPRLSEGYCTDDHTRAVSFLLHLKPLLAPGDWEALEPLLERCWCFVVEAEQPGGQYFNFRTAEGEWLWTPESDDMYARLVRMLMFVLVIDTSVERRMAAAAMWERLGERVAHLAAIRGWAEVIIGLTESGAFPGVGSFTTELGKRLFKHWQHQATKEWPWFEPLMTYANALLPHALLRLWRGGSTGVEEALHQSARFLLTSTVREKVFIPIGSVGWYPKGGQPSDDNQQAIEAGTMFDFLLEYATSFPERLTVADVVAPYLWFFGQNTSRTVLVDQQTGACFDGILSSGINKNCGAESLLAYLWAEVRVRESSPAVADYAFKRRQELLADLKP